MFILNHAKRKEVAAPPAVIEYRGVDIVTNSSASFSTQVTVPADTTYVVVMFGGWSSSTPNVNSITFGGAAMDYLYSHDLNQANYAYGVATTPGNKTFNLNLSGGWDEGGLYAFVFLKGVNSSNPLVAADDINGFSSNVESQIIAAVVDGIGLVYASGYYDEHEWIMNVLGQTELVDQPYNSDRIGVAYKLTTGATVELGAQRPASDPSYSSAILFNLRP